MQLEVRLLYRKDRKNYHLGNTCLPIGKRIVGFYHAKCSKKLIWTRVYPNNQKVADTEKRPYNLAQFKKSASKHDNAPFSGFLNSAS